MTDNTQTLHNAENERLKKQLDIAMKALRHYADETTWQPSPDDPDGVDDLYCGYSENNVELNGFAVAQQAIEDVEKWRT